MAAEAMTAEEKVEVTAEETENVAGGDVGEENGNGKSDET